MADIARSSFHFDSPVLGELVLPYFEVTGRDGPTLALIAGVHGCEYSTIAAVRDVVRAVEDDPRPSLPVVPGHYPSHPDLLSSTKCGGNLTDGRHHAHLVSLRLAGVGRPRNPPLRRNRWQRRTGTCVDRRRARLRVLLDRRGRGCRTCARGGRARGACHGHTRGERRSSRRRTARISIVASRVAPTGRSANRSRTTSSGPSPTATT